MGNYTPQRLTWNLKISPWKRKKTSSKPSFSGSMLIFGGVVVHPGQNSHFEQMEVDGSDDFPFLCSVIFR